MDVSEAKRLNHCGRMLPRHDLTARAESDVAGVDSDFFAVGLLDQQSSVFGDVYGATFDHGTAARRGDVPAEGDQTVLPGIERHVIAGDCVFVERFEVVAER